MTTTETPTITRPDLTWAVTKLEHPALRDVREEPCDLCLAHVDSAIAHARVTGSVGATYGVTGSGGDHGVTVARVHALVELSR